jgi:hypothetical protein
MCKEIDSQIQNPFELKVAERSHNGLRTLKLNLYCKHDPNPKNRTICTPCAQTNLSMNQVKADDKFKIVVVVERKFE